MVRVVRKGTFVEFRDWKIGKGMDKGMGHVKVPAVVFDAETAAWLEERVVEEVSVRV